MNDEPELERHLCNRKACLLARIHRGIPGGHFLFAHAWTKGGIIIETTCPDCGTVHRVLLYRPKEDSDGQERF